MNTTRNLAALAAVTLTATLATAVATTPSQADPPNMFRITATVSTVEPVQGDTIKIKGQVKPVRPGATVILQKRYDTKDKWKTADTDTLNGKGKFKFKDKVGSVRFRQYRVVKPAQGGRSRGKSDKLPVTVFGWRSLTSLNPVITDGTYETKALNINGAAYEQSVIGNSYSNAGSIAYNVNRACKRFEGRVGLSDASEVTATGAITLKSDAAAFYSNSFELTESASVSRDITGVFRLTMDWTSTNTEGTPTDQSGAVAALGSPRLLCSF